MPIWTLAKKDLRLLLRDRRAVVILLAMPLIFILVLGLSLGEGFGQKPDDKLRVSVVDLDQPPALPADVKVIPYGLPTWSQVVQRDLTQTGEIRIEVIPSREEAERLVRSGKRAAVIYFGPNFSRRVHRSSFLADGINPFFRDGVKLSELDMDVLKDPTQLTAGSIIEQALQVSLLRVVLPWMIGRAFEKIGDQLGFLVQRGLKQMFPNYDLTGKTWAALTKSQERSIEEGAAVQEYKDDAGSGLLKRGAASYQRLVPAQTVMFAFFLVLTVGWLFVAERRQGTLKRLRAAPLSTTQILLGKLLPCLVLSLSQGLFLLAAGKLVFAMDWGPQPWLLLPVVVTTSLAATGLALFVAALARTETQVAIYGTLLVLVLAGVSGCLMGDRELMPEGMQNASRFTPHAWALDAYKQLLTNPQPELGIVVQACLVLTAFGAGFVLLAWCFVKLED